MLLWDEDLCRLIGWMASDLIRSRATLEAEIWTLRQQISVLQRTAPKKHSFCPIDRSLVSTCQNRNQCRMRFWSTQGADHDSGGATTTTLDHTRNLDGGRLPSSPSPAIRTGIWRCAMPRANCRKIEDAIRDTSSA